jgi:hypothetical protein
MNETNVLFVLRNSADHQWFQDPFTSSVLIVIVAFTDQFAGLFGDDSRDSLMTIRRQAIPRQFSPICVNVVLGIGNLLVLFQFVENHRYLQSIIDVAKHFDHLSYLTFVFDTCAMCLKDTSSIFIRRLIREDFWARILLYMERCELAPD